MEDNILLTKELGPVEVRLILGAITAYIAWRQYRVAHSKLSLDLFERRYKVFVHIWAICIDAVGQQKSYFMIYIARTTPFDEFWPQASFLFGADVNKFIEQTVAGWLTLSRLERQAEKDPMILEERKEALVLVSRLRGPKSEIAFRHLR